MTLPSEPPRLTSSRFETETYARLFPGQGRPAGIPADNLPVQTIVVFDDPLERLALNGREADSALAFNLGLGCGVCLQRAGLGRLYDLLGSTLTLAQLGAQF